MFAHSLASDEHNLLHFVQLIKQERKSSVCKLSASYDSLINPLSLRRLLLIRIFPLSCLRIRDPYFCLLSGWIHLKPSS